MSRVFLGALIALVVSLPAVVKVQAFLPSFRTKAPGRRPKGLNSAMSARIQ
jgi:hypothetical protein